METMRRRRPPHPDPVGDRGDDRIRITCPREYAAGWACAGQHNCGRCRGGCRLAGVRRRGSPAALQIVRLTGFFHRKGLSAPEQTDALAELQKATGFNNKELAEHLHLDPSTVTRLLAPLKCIPEVLKAYKAEKINLSEAYEFFKLTPEEQAAALIKKLSGEINGKVAIAAQRKKPQPTEGVKRIRIELASGVTVVFTSDSGLTLDTALTAATEAGREIKRGLSEGLSPKTLSKAASERAKGGANGRSPA